MIRLVSIYKKLNSILEASNSALVYKGLDTVTSIKDFIEVLPSINRLPYLLKNEIILLTAEDFGKSTKIVSYAFYNCTSLESVTIPDSVTTIGESAFEDCTSLESVTIPDSVTTIGKSAFSGCNNIKKVCISDTEAWCNITFTFNSSNPLSNGADLYLNGELLTSIIIPDSVTSIGYSAFYNCKRLRSVTIPDSVTSIGGSAFYNCDNLESVTIPDSVISIGDLAFEDCTSLSSVTIGNGVESIGKYAFSRCTNLETLVIGNGITDIASGAFDICNKLYIWLKATTPPKLSASLTSVQQINVPVGCGAAYKSATNWSKYSSKIVENNTITT